MYTGNLSHFKIRTETIHKIPACPPSRVFPWGSEKIAIYRGGGTWYLVPGTLVPNTHVFTGTTGT